MTRGARRNHTPAFKAKVALAAVKGDRALAQLAEQFDVHANQITSWKAQLEAAPPMCSGQEPACRGATRHRCEVAAHQDRRADAGERFFRRSAHQGGIAGCKAMIDREHDLPITKQAEALNISRGSVYYLPRPVLSADLAIMQRLYQLHPEFPFAGSRMLRGLLAAEGSKIGRRHVKTLMRRIEALYRRPRTTKPEPGHKIYAYLLRGMEIMRPNQSGRWISPTSRCRVASSISPSCWTGRPAGFCRGGCRSRWRRPSASRHLRTPWRVTASRRYSTPTKVRSSLVRRSPAHSPAMASPSAWTAKGTWRDNVFVERLWRSVKYEEMYLRAYDSVSDARASIGRYLDLYNGRRPHSSLDGGTPDQAYFSLPSFRMAA